MDWNTMWNQPKYYYVRDIKGLTDFIQAYSKYYQLVKDSLSDEIIDYMLRFNDLYKDGIFDKMVNSGKPVAVPYLTKPNDMRTLAKVSDFEASVKACEPENIKNGKAFFGGYNVLGQRLPPDRY